MDTAEVLLSLEPLTFLGDDDDDEDDDDNTTYEIGNCSRLRGLQGRGRNLIDKLSALK
jgi:hypothetical protein